MDKTCTNCKFELPLTSDYFHVDKTNPTGYKSWCKVCIQILTLLKTECVLPFTVDWKVPKEGYKFCTKCGEEKKLDTNNFALDKSNPSGFTPHCKVCFKSYTDQRYQENRDKILKANEKWRTENLEHKRELGRLYRQNFPEKHCAEENKRRAAKLQACPTWVDLKVIEDIYRNRPQGYHVDHIVPLKGKNVCGLHVPWNLQYLTASENAKKSNKLLFNCSLGLANRSVLV